MLAAPMGKGPLLSFFVICWLCMATSAAPVPVRPVPGVLSELGGAKARDQVVAAPGPAAVLPDNSDLESMQTQAALMAHEADNVVADIESQLPADLATLNAPVPGRPVVQNQVELQSLQTPPADQTQGASTLPVDTDAEAVRSQPPVPPSLAKAAGSANPPLQDQTGKTPTPLTSAVEVQTQQLVVNAASEALAAPAAPVASAAPEALAAPASPVASAAPEALAAPAVPVASAASADGLTEAQIRVIRQIVAEQQAKVEAQPLEGTPVRNPTQMAQSLQEPERPQSLHTDQEEIPPPKRHSRHTDQEEIPPPKRQSFQETQERISAQSEDQGEQGEKKKIPPVALAQLQEKLMGMSTEELTELTPEFMHQMPQEVQETVNVVLAQHSLPPLPISTRRTAAASALMEQDQQVVKAGGLLEQGQTQSSSAKGETKLLGRSSFNGKARTMSSLDLRCVLCQYWVQRVLGVVIQASSPGLFSFAEVSSKITPSSRQENSTNSKNSQPRLMQLKSKLAALKSSTSASHMEIGGAEQPALVEQKAKVSAGPGVVADSRRFAIPDLMDNVPFGQRFDPIHPVQPNANQEQQRAQYHLIQSLAYQQLYTMCSQRTPEPYFEYCGTLLKRFREVAQGLHYGDRPDQICMNVGLCSKASYIQRAPHATFPVAYPI